jgi:hypothetical protein
MEKAGGLLLPTHTPLPCDLHLLDKAKRLAASSSPDYTGNLALVPEQVPHDIASTPAGDSLAPTESTPHS